MAASARSRNSSHTVGTTTRAAINTVMAKAVGQARPPLRTSRRTYSGQVVNAKMPAHNMETAKGARTRATALPSATIKRPSTLLRRVSGPIKGWGICNPLARGGYRFAVRRSLRRLSLTERGVAQRLQQHHQGAGTTMCRLGLHKGYHLRALDQPAVYLVF